MNPWNAYLRWRHSKGYGVHSPYAYKFITDVVNPGNYGYYAYHNLDFTLPSERSFGASDYNKAKFIIRLVNFLKTERIVADMVDTYIVQTVTQALNLRFCNAEGKEQYFKKGDLFIVSEIRNEDTLKKILNKEVSILALNPDSHTRKLIEIPLKHGVLFNWKNKLLLIPRPEMEYLAYNL